jgi:hypothetical protein
MRSECWLAISRTIRSPKYSGRLTWVRDTTPRAPAPQRCSTVATEIPSPVKHLIFRLWARAPAARETGDSTCTSASVRVGPAGLASRELFGWRFWLQRNLSGCRMGLFGGFAVDVLVDACGRVFLNANSRFALIDGLTSDRGQGGAAQPERVEWLD